MSISYIRFFSPTQILPDGLLLLFMFVLIYISIKIGILMVTPTVKDSSKNKNKIEDFYFTNIQIDKMSHYNIKVFNTPIKQVLVPWISIISLLVFIPYLFYYFFISNYRDFNFSLLIISIPILITIIFLGYLNIRNIKNSYMWKVIIKWINHLPKVLQNALNFLFSIIIIMIILYMTVFILFKTLSIFHQVYLFPDNLINMRYIQKNNDTNNTKISYMNDKYIFLECRGKDKNISIEILKFDELFKK